ncbi:hypothetical protein AWB76_00491 [Caballeronia temeraria]|uniref:Uncharacterized protein n=1 Tax=Caballeronia temeraria TaxID=1777137 RepID=A0A157ZC25_9BURK|nr:hypothetical protein AWB76_00491 [Caballeronia temeraria]
MPLKKKLARRPATRVFGGYCASILARRSNRYHRSGTKITCLTKSESVVYPLICGRRHLSLGIGVPENTSAQPRNAVFLCATPLFVPVNGRAVAGEPSGSPVPCVPGTPTPPCARPPQLALGSGFSTRTQEATMRANDSARSEQTQSPLHIQIINRALRDAALAPSANDALDCCAEALLHLAEIARAEVSHG